MQEAITQFIKKQRCASICCIDENGSPYCFTCFYVLNGEKAFLYFKSSANAHHIKLLKPGSVVAGTILPDKLSLLTAKGVQFQGVIIEAQEGERKEASSLYHKRFPFAYAFSGDVWTIRLDFVKLTDNSKGFGNKTAWDRSGV